MKHTDEDRCRASGVQRDQCGMDLGRELFRKLFPA